MPKRELVPPFQQLSHLYPGRQNGWPPQGPGRPDAPALTHRTETGGGTVTGGGYTLYSGPQTSLLTVRDADAEHAEVTVALKSNLAKNVRAGSKTSQKITVLDPDGFAMTITADKQPAEGGGVVKVTVDLGQPAPAGFSAKINSSASTATFGHSHMLAGGVQG